ncbi:MAG TPA: HNH endonuclease [Segetibacter sp.]
MEDKSLEVFIKKFNRLKVATYKNSKAPHKPILLLSIIQSIEQNELTTNKIYITANLVAPFKDNWHHFVTNQNFTANFSLPFYHLQSEKFWFLKTLPGREIALTTSHSIKSFSHLKEVVDYAFFDESLFGFLLDIKTRDVLKQTLLSTYFKVYSLEVRYHLSLVAGIKTEILNEDPAVYKTKANSFDEEEVFIRDGVFKKVVPQIYNYTCCISGMRIIASSEVQMIDACHIIPFSESHDDTISNGISLCPNLHRAFNRGLISVNGNYQVIVSTAFAESSVDYSIKQYEGKRLSLPKDQAHFPSLGNLNWHLLNTFIK